MSLDLYFKKVLCTYCGNSEEKNFNITHNLAKMAQEANLYYCLWRAEKGFTARGLIDPLEHGLSRLKEDPAHFKTFNSSNGWGVYENFVEFVSDVLKYCKENPDAIITCVSV